MLITLWRTKEDQYGTHGHLEKIDGELLCYTIEQPWRDNHPYIEGETDKVSCVIPGLFQCEPHNTAAHPDCWQLIDVPNRSAVLIHTGNTEKDTKGCIIVGLDFTEQGVGRSVLALEKLRGILPANFQLDIKTLIK